MPGDQPIAESTEPKIDAWSAYEKRRLGGLVSLPELIPVLPALVTLKGDLISSHLYRTRDY
jgi:hypothetical protein